MDNRLLYAISFIAALSIASAEEGKATDQVGNATKPPDNEPLSIFVDSQGRTKEEVDQDKLKMRPIFLTGSMLQSTVVSTFDRSLPEKERTKLLNANDTSFCMVTPDTGYWCDGSQGKGDYTTRYYFNKYTEKCRCFMYYGCDGNANNFETLNDCVDTCSAVGVEKSDICDYFP
ncbi:trophoblast Kunitz domain protein 1-like isoform X2 [Leptotrombidium deliense]|uniref:Trophoblast Kunitz domain protein 1-like isoform X2 n=1 Tax=Leptotrombidium deliense TaxID=299467 RepID=A0A443SM93_9ACAR|nr:trophoblast Kunitz domain protein 1-like isoform X2 [Leptotrombidium deliense]